MWSIMIWYFQHVNAMGRERDLQEFIFLIPKLLVANK